jgi:hypothetical protein
MFNPQSLAKFAANGISAVDPKDLPALLSALIDQRRVLWADRPPVGPKGRPFLCALSRLDALIAEVRHAAEPTEDTAEELRIATCRAAFDAYVVAFGCDPS